MSYCCLFYRNSLSYPTGFVLIALNIISIIRGWRSCIPSAIAFLAGSFPDQVDNDASDFYVTNAFLRNGF